MNNITYKKFYALSGNFISTTGPYQGYVTALSGTPYIYNTNTQLIPQQTFESSLYISSYGKNRAITDTDSTLPYNENDVLFAHNDYLLGRVAYDKLSKLHDNNTFIYSKLFMANNDLPAAPSVTYAYVSDKNAKTLSIGTGYSNSIPYNQNIDPRIKALGSLNSFVVLENKDISEQYALFGVTDTQIVILSGNKTEVNFIEVSEYIESEENELRYGKLESIATSNDFIYITDSKNNVIYKYGIETFINNDQALFNKRNLIEILGGQGAAKLKTKFRTPKQITSNSKYVAIHDAGNRVIKVYDPKFNYHGRITTLPLKKQELAALEFNPHTSNLHILCYTQDYSTLNLYIIKVDGKIELINTINNLELSLLPGETVQNIEFSKNTSDYYYICTNKNLYKLHTTRPEKVIGRYQEPKLFNSATSTVNDTRVITVSTVPKVTITPPRTFTQTSTTLVQTTDNFGITGQQVINIPEVKFKDPDITLNLSRIVTIPGYNREVPIIVNASNIWNAVQINFIDSNWYWNGGYDVPSTRTEWIPPSSYTEFYTQVIEGKTYRVPANVITIPAQARIIPGDVYEETIATTTTIPGVTSFESGNIIKTLEFYQREVVTLSMFNDSYRGFRIIPSLENYDNVFFCTDARLYNFNEPNTFKQIIKDEQLTNFGKSSVYLTADEYIQASTINKELYKVTRDIFAIKNDLVGRFDGTYDSNGIFTLKDYNYNIDFSQFDVLEQEDYYVHENEKSILGVLNRALQNILNLQRELLTFTTPDTSRAVKTIYNDPTSQSVALLIT